MSVRRCRSSDRCWQKARLPETSLLSQYCDLLCAGMFCILASPTSDLRFEHGISSERAATARGCIIAAQSTSIPDVMNGHQEKGGEKTKSEWEELEALTKGELIIELVRARTCYRGLRGEVRKKTSGLCRRTWPRPFREEPATRTAASRPRRNGRRRSRCTARCTRRTARSTGAI